MLLGYQQGGNAECDNSNRSHEDMCFIFLYVDYCDISDIHTFASFNTPLISVLIVVNKIHS